MREDLITLQRARDAGPCADGWIKFLATIRESADFNPDRLFSVGDVAVSNGLDDALWCLQLLPPKLTVTAVMPAVKRASAHTTDTRVHETIQTVQRWIDGDTTVDLRSARKTARSAAIEAKRTTTRMKRTATWAESGASWATADAARAAATTANAAIEAAGSADAAYAALVATAWVATWADPGEASPLSAAAWAAACRRATAVACEALLQDILSYFPPYALA